MTKSDIITKIAKQTGIEKVVVYATIDALTNEIQDSLSNGRNVYLRGFGSFMIKERAAKTGRDIAKNITISIPAHSVPIFRPAKSFADKVKTGTKK